MRWLILYSLLWVAVITWAAWPIITGQVGRRRSKKDGYRR